MSRDDTGVFLRGKVWYIRYDLPPAPGGKRRAIMKSCKGMTKEEAITELAKIKNQLVPGPVVTIYGQDEIIYALGGQHNIARRYDTWDLIHPGLCIGRGGSIRVREEKMPNHINAIFTYLQSAEVLTWNERLGLSARETILQEIGKGE